MYLCAGSLAKTATVVRAAMTLFTNGPDGMTGNDDLGTMSAWYVFSSLGLYPTTSGGDFLALSSPQFPTATVHIGQRQLVITAPGVTDANRYVQNVSLNGRGVARSWLGWDDISRGGSLRVDVGPAPSNWATSPSAEPPSINHAAPDSRRHVDASVRGLNVDVLGQAPGTLPVAEVGHVAAQHLDMPLMYCPRAGDQGKQAGFADAVRSDQADHAAGGDVRRYGIESLDLSIDMADVLQPRDLS